MKQPRWTEADMTRAVMMVFEGAIQTDAAEATGVSQSCLSNRLNELICRHPKCSEYTPCTAAFRRHGGLMTCTLLEDVDFGDRVCPFYKVDKEKLFERRGH